MNVDFDELIDMVALLARHACANTEEYKHELEEKIRTRFDYFNERMGYPT